MVVCLVHGTIPSLFGLSSQIPWIGETSWFRKHLFPIRQRWNLLFAIPLVRKELT